VGAGGRELDEHIKQLEAQVKTLTDKVNREVSRLEPPVWNPVSEWKRKACEEVLGVMAPPGRAPLCQKPAVHAFDCFDSTCTYKRKKCRLDTYIKHVLDRHKFNIRSMSVEVEKQNEYLPRRSA